MNQDPHVDPPGPTARASGAVVLVGFDGSESSRDALSWASGEARRLRGRILAVFVSSSADIVVGRSAKARHHQLGSLGRRLAGKRDAPVVVVVPSCGLLNPAWPG